MYPSLKKKKEHWLKGYHLIGTLASCKTIKPDNVPMLSLKYF